MKFICPRCHADLQEISDLELLCKPDNLVFKKENGIWKFLPPERESYYQRFISDYEMVRHLEGRFSADASYYRALPFQDLSGKFPADWRIRAASFLALQKILPATSTVLDVGAGNGWLSNRLSLLGYDVCAVDLLLNPEDGLGAGKHYQSLFEKVQSEFMHLPFPKESVSSVIFNASFHYSENYEATLSEVLQILSPNGMVIVMDSPVYGSSKFGEQMMAEQRASFLRRYGFASDSLKSKGFLTYQGMQELGEKLGIIWQHIRPFYGLRWVSRPFWARLRGLRQPAEFGLWVAKKP